MKRRNKIHARTSEPVLIHLLIFFPNLRSQGFKIKIFKYFKKKLKNILSYTFKPTAGRPQLFCLVDRN